MFARNVLMYQRSHLNQKEYDEFALIKKCDFLNDKTSGTIQDRSRKKRSKDVRRMTPELTTEKLILQNRIMHAFLASSSLSHVLWVSQVADIQSQKKRTSLFVHQQILARPNCRFGGAGRRHPCSVEHTQLTTRIDMCVFVCAISVHVLC